MVACVKHGLTPAERQKLSRRRHQMRQPAVARDIHPRLVHQVECRRLLRARRPPRAGQQGAHRQWPHPASLLDPHDASLSALRRVGVFRDLVPRRFSGFASRLSITGGKAKSRRTRKRKTVRHPCAAVSPDRFLHAPCQSQPALSTEALPAPADRFIADELNDADTDDDTDDMSVPPQIMRPSEDTADEPSR